jgi:signal transduction histidine kinase
MLSISLLRPFSPSSLLGKSLIVFGAAVELGPAEPEPRVAGLPPEGGRPPGGKSTRWGRDGREIPPYRLGVNSQAAATAGLSELQRERGREKTAYLWIRLLGVAAIAFVVTTSFSARPPPGGHGQALGVAFALIVFCCATAAAMWLTPPSPAVQLAVLLLAVAGAAALIGLQGNGAGFLGVFPAVCLAGFVLPARLSAVVAGAAIGAVSAAWVSNGRAPIAGIVLNDFGILAFYLLSLFARRLRQSNQRAEALLTELEQTRAAHAQAATLAERQRVAREMHDVLAHSLSGLVLNLEGAMLLAGQGGADPPVSDAIGRAHRLARTGLEEARRAIGMLRDDALPGPQRLFSLAAEFEADTGVACQVTVTGAETDLGTDGRLTLYRVAQEALTNIRKHARPGRVEIRLAYEPSGTRLAIEDFRKPGELPAQGPGTGYGLTGMRERAELLGGTLAAGPTGSGFLVELRVPA